MATSDEVLLDLTLYPAEKIARLQSAFAGKFSTEAQAIALAAFNTFVNQDFKTNVASLARSIDFVGFDPIKIMEQMQEVVRMSDETGEFTIVDENNVVILTISKRANEKQDIALFVLFFIERGSLIKKILKNLQTQWVDAFTFKVKQYRLDHGRKGSELLPGDITLARIAGCVPHYAVILLHLGVGKVYVNKSILDDAFGVDYPRCVLTQLFSGVVPVRGTGKEYLDHCFYYSFMFDQIINPKRIISDYKTYLDEIENFVRASHSATLYDDYYRQTVLVEVGLLNYSNNGFGYSSIGSQIMRAGIDMWAMVKNSYSTDMAKTTISSYLDRKSAIQHPAIIPEPRSSYSSPPTTHSASPKKKSVVYSTLEVETLDDWANKMQNELISVVDTYGAAQTALNREAIFSVLAKNYGHYPEGATFSWVHNNTKIPLKDIKAAVFDTISRLKSPK